MKERERSGQKHVHDRCSHHSSLCSHTELMLLALDAPTRLSAPPRADCLHIQGPTTGQSTGAKPACRLHSDILDMTQLAKQIAFSSDSGVSAEFVFLAPF